MASELNFAETLAARLPVCGEPPDGEELISLCDIVVTGIETPFAHFDVLTYSPNADGARVPWAVIQARFDAFPNKKNIKSIDLYAGAVRKAVIDYLQNRIDAGMDLLEAAKMVDGVYTDALVADSILQFALYGEEVFG